MFDMQLKEILGKLSIKYPPLFGSQPNLDTFYPNVKFYTFV